MMFLIKSGSVFSLNVFYCLMIYDTRLKPFMFIEAWWMHCLNCFALVPLALQNGFDIAYFLKCYCCMSSTKCFFILCLLFDIQNLMIFLKKHFIPHSNHLKSEHIFTLPSAFVDIHDAQFVFWCLLREYKVYCPAHTYCLRNKRLHDTKDFMKQKTSWNKRQHTINSIYILWLSVKLLYKESHALIVQALLPPENLIFNCKTHITYCVK